MMGDRRPTSDLIAEKQGATGPDVPAQPREHAPRRLSPEVKQLVLNAWFAGYWTAVERPDYSDTGLVLAERLWSEYELEHGLR